MRTSNCLLLSLRVLPLASAIIIIAFWRVEIKCLLREFSGIPLMVIKINLCTANVIIVKILSTSPPGGT